jgi:phage-related minor tail protein
VALDVGELVAHLRVGAEGMARGLRDGESRFRKFGDKLTSLAAGAGLAAAAAFGAAIFANMNQDALGAKLAAQLGGTTEDAKAYGKLAGKLYAENWGESIEQIGETLRDVARADITDGTAAGLEDITRRAQIMGDVFGQDVKGSIEAVQQMIRTGLVPDAKAGFDLLAAGIQGGVDKAEDLNDTFVEYGTQFRALGLTGAEAMGLMNQALKGGARDADTAADALKEFTLIGKDLSKTKDIEAALKPLGMSGKQFQTDVAAGGEKASAAIGALLNKLQTVKDPIQQNAIATALFGTKAEDLQKALFSMDLDSAAAEFGNVAGAIDKAGAAIGESDSAKIEGFKRSAMAAAQALAADLVPSLTEAGGWIKKNQEWIKPLAVTLGSLAVAIIAVNLATKAWMATERAFAAVKAMATAAQWLFNAALWASPITWIVIGIIALIAVIVLIATKTTWFQQGWAIAWGFIKDNALGAWALLKTFWSWLVGFYHANVAAVISMKDGVVKAWNAVIDFLTTWKNKVKAVFDAVGDFIGAGFNKGKEAARTAINGVIGFVNNALGAINGLINLANKVPGVNIPTIHGLPKLAGGGAVMPNGSRGTPVIMGDGGEVEYGVPKSDMRQIIGDAVRAGGGAGGGTMRIVLELVKDSVLKVVRTEVGAKGGNVQTVLGPRR